MYSRSVASYFKVRLVRSDIVNQYNYYGVVYNMVLCTIWCCVQYGVVYSMVLCTIWCCVQYGVVYNMVLCTIWYCVQYGVVCL